MAINIKPVDTIPESTYRKGPRHSKCMEVVDAAKLAPSHKVALDSEDPDELDKLYKSLIQWRTRHKTENVGIRKDKDVVYVWIEEK